MWRKSKFILWTRDLNLKIVIPMKVIRTGASRSVRKSKPEPEGRLEASAAFLSLSSTEEVQSVQLPKVNRRQRGTRYDSPKLIVKWKWKWSEVKVTLFWFFIFLETFIFYGIGGTLT